MGNEADSLLLNHGGMATESVWCYRVNVSLFLLQRFFRNVFLNFF